MDANTYFTVQEERLEAEWDRKLEDAEAMRSDMVLRKFLELTYFDVTDMIPYLEDHVTLAAALQRIVRESRNKDQLSRDAIHEAALQIAQLMLAECDTQYGDHLVQQAAHGTGEGKL